MFKVAARGSFRMNMLEDALPAVEPPKYGRAVGCIDEVQEELEDLETQLDRDNWDKTKSFVRLEAALDEMEEDKRLEHEKVVLTKERQQILDEHESLGLKIPFMEEDVFTTQETATTTATATTSPTTITTTEEKNEESKLEPSNNPTDEDLEEKQAMDDDAIEEIWPSKYGNFPMLEDMTEQDMANLYSRDQEDYEEDLLDAYDDEQADLAASEVPEHKEIHDGAWTVEGYDDPNGVVPVSEEEYLEFEEDKQPFTEEEDNPEEGANVFWDEDSPLFHDWLEGHLLPSISTHKKEIEKEMLEMKDELRRRQILEERADEREIEYTTIENHVDSMKESLIKRLKMVGLTNEELSALGLLGGEEELVPEEEEDDLLEDYVEVKIPVNEEYLKMKHEEELQQRQRGEEDELRVFEEELD